MNRAFFPVLEEAALPLSASSVMDNMGKGSPIPAVMKMPKPASAATGIEDVVSSNKKLPKFQSQTQSTTTKPLKPLQTLPEGVCGTCEAPIAGKAVTAIDRTWHPEHFVCTHCQKEIGSGKFFEQEGRPYCEKDYQGLFLDRCHWCKRPIEDEIVFALEKTWHPEHFSCAQCGDDLQSAYHKKNEKALCSTKCYDMFEAKCSGCHSGILEDYIPAIGSFWHPECFVCSECSMPFTDGIFFNHNRKLYCEKHYNDVKDTPWMCFLMNTPNFYMINRATKINPGLFICTSCLKQVDENAFQQQNDKPYCQDCSAKLFT